MEREGKLFLEFAHLTLEEAVDVLYKLVHYEPVEGDNIPELEAKILRLIEDVDTRLGALKKFRGAEYEK
jgi:hypothetical protein